MADERRATGLEAAVRATVASQLRRSQAHVGLLALDDLTPALRGRRVDGHAHTAWQLVEHLRRCAVDFVEYLERADYEAHDWPEGYWPSAPEPPSDGAWDDAVDGLRSATETLARWLEDPARELTERAPTATDPQHHLLRCALVLLDHNAYHLGQLVVLRRALDAWPPG